MAGLSILGGWSIAWGPFAWGRGMPDPSDRPQEWSAWSQGKYPLSFAGTARLESRNWFVDPALNRSPTAGRRPKSFLFHRGYGGHSF